MGGMFGLKGINAWHASSYTVVIGRIMVLTNSQEVPDEHQKSQSRKIRKWSLGRLQAHRAKSTTMMLAHGRYEHALTHSCIHALISGAPQAGRLAGGGSIKNVVDVYPTQLSKMPEPLGSRGPCFPCKLQQKSAVGHA